MARKYDLISELYNRTCKTVVSSPENWQAFLTSACRNYKLRFDEQLLVFAQRPDATAVLEIERWNKSFGRWVNKGATGIAVFDDVSRSHQWLIHYFDISDTHESRYSRPVPIWSMKPEYEEEIIETLESTFGTIEDKSSLASAILGAARNATEDNIPDYIRDLLYSTNNSFLEELDEDAISSIYKKTVANSVAYMTMERLGTDTEEYFFREDFEDIINFNTPETLNALGFATSDIAEMGLAEIAKTIMSLEKQNRIIAETQNSDYNVVKENQTERSLENDRIDLHDAGRLQTAQSDRTGSVGNSDGTLLSTEGEVPEGKPQSSVLQSPDELQTERTSDGSGTDGNRTDGTLNEGIVFKFPAFFARTNTALVLKEPKTKTSTRKVFLPKTVAEMLRNRYQEIQEYKELFGDEFQDFNLVFCSANGRPMESQIITRALQKLIRENNLPPVVFHSLRHTSITYKLKLNGGDIKSVQGDSGHAQVKMVTDVYSHILDEDRRLNAQRFEEAFYQHKELSESSAEKLKSDTQNTHSDDDRKPPQDGGITDETMLNYLINNPEFLQKFKTLLGV